MPDTVILRTVTTADLTTLLAWRNHPTVRAAMFSQHEISSTEHHAWFERVSIDPARRLLIAEDTEGPFGFVQFGNVAPGGISEWGFYARPAAPRGSGTRLCAAALDYAFQVAALHKICGEVITTNAASLALHRRLGFVEEGMLRDQKYVDGVYHSLLCFGLLEHEWNGAPQNRRS